jgi:hypothetical protein
MALTSLDVDILSEKYDSVRIHDLWDELDSLELHFNIAFERSLPIAKEYFDEMNFLKDLIKSRPLDERTALLDFFREHQHKSLGNNDFEAAEYFKRSAERFEREYM